MLRYVILSFVKSDPLLDGIRASVLCKLVIPVYCLRNLHYQKVLMSRLSEYYGVIKLLSGASKIRKGDTCSFRDAIENHDNGGFLFR